LIAGLEEPTAGLIRFDDHVVNGLEPWQRNIAMVFQSYALYPHMTVAKNMAFGLEQRKYPKSEIEELVKRAADMLGISGLLDRKPVELSGGQRQRAAMGRAIVRRPKAFLFDEPLSNLDAALRAQMRIEIKKLHEMLATTVIYVTHDQIEAMTLGDRIVVMNEGEVVQIGDPMSIYEKPKTKFVAGFIGAPKMNFIPCRVVDSPGIGLALELTPEIVLPVPESARKACMPYLNQRMELGLRPEHIVEGRDSIRDGASFEATVEVIEPTGADTLVFFSISGTYVAARCRPRGISQVGKRVPFTADMSRMHLIDHENDTVISN
jgi:multiple sugar transport system ATP-binding protein